MTLERNDTDGDTEVVLFAFQILSPATSLEIPPAMLGAGSEYQFGVAVETADGNVTVTESSFFIEP